MFSVLNMPDINIMMLCTIFTMAVIYSSVGHGGASGYLAAMVLWGLAPETMRPAALTMNIVVTAWLLLRFNRFNLFPHKLFWPLVVTSMPFAFLGGIVKIDAFSYQILVAILLIVAACRMLFISKQKELSQHPKIVVALIAGAILGFSAGLTGIGGGIFLSPILLIFGWCTIRESTGIAAGFILLNSVGGLAGYLMSNQNWPPETNWLIPMAFIGCLIGAEVASHKASMLVLRKILSVVLIMAGFKMAYTAII